MKVVSNIDVTQESEPHEKSVATFYCPECKHSEYREYPKE